MDERRAEPWRAIDDLFAAALERPEAERRDFLESATTDPEVRRAVVNLLDAEARCRSFLEHRTDELFGALAEYGGLDGERLGAYRLLSPIGRGGMATVYLAVRDDGTYEHQVAVKVMHDQGPVETHGRFLVERQILARLSHPNIARLLDGGVTSRGQPYLVMELVEGVRIDEFCERHDLSVEERLELFLQVCDAVSQAHRNLLVHRDLKPGNILVSAEGVPKLLDFGIAKLLEPERFSTPSWATRTGHRPMSLAYASPEQIRGEAITTASDVYALGVLLFELLTGRDPYGLEEPTLHELEQAVLERDPPQPSEVVEHGLAGTKRGSEPSGSPWRARALSRRLRGDLDKIVQMALRKDPERRYAGAEALAADLRRHLAREPVRAQADRWSYRLRKLWERNRLAVSVGALSSFLLLVAAAISILLAWNASQARTRAEAERAVAETERTKAEAVSDFFNELIQLANPREAPQADLTVREVLERGYEEIDRLADQPELQARMRSFMGNAFRGLGRLDEAEELLEGAVADLRRILPDSPELVEALNELASLRQEQGELVAAAAGFEEGLAILRAAPEQDLLLQAMLLNNLGLLSYLNDDFDQAQAHYTESLAIQRQLGSLDREGAILLSNLAIVIHARGDYEAAEPLYRESLSLWRSAEGGVSSSERSTLGNLGTLYRDMGRLEAADATLQETLNQFRQALGDDHPDLLQPLRKIALLRFLQGRNGESEALYRRCLAIVEAVDPEHPMAARMLTGLGRLLLERDAVKEAASRLARAVDIFEKRLPADHWRTAYARAVLAACWSRSGRLQEAEPVLRAGHRAVRGRLGPREPRARDALRLLIEHLERSGKMEEARRLQEELP